MGRVSTFLKTEDGAVTVDWVVLTAALVGLGLAVMSVVSGGIENLSNDIGQTLTDTNPLDSPFDDNTDFTETAPAADPV